MYNKTVDVHLQERTPWTTHVKILLIIQIHSWCITIITTIIIIHWMEAIWIIITIIPTQLDLRLCKHRQSWRCNHCNNATMNSLTVSSNSLHLHKLTLRKNKLTSRINWRNSLRRKCVTNWQIVRCTRIVMARRDSSSSLNLKWEVVWIVIITRIMEAITEACLEEPSTRDLNNKFDHLREWKMKTISMRWKKKCIYNNSSSNCSTELLHHRRCNNNNNNSRRNLSKMSNRDLRTNHRFYTHRECTSVPLILKKRKRILIEKKYFFALLLPSPCFKKIKDDCYVLYL